MVIVLESAPKRYFDERLAAASLKTGIELEPAINDYVVSVLTKFVKTENFRERPVLAEAILKLRNARNLEGAIGYVQVGDSCMFISSFLEGYVNRKLKDVNYCIKVGETSYGMASLFLKTKIKDSAELFSKMEHNFRDLVGIVSEALGAVEFKESEDIAYLIEKYIATGSRDALKRLNELGINIPDFRGKA